MIEPMKKVTVAYQTAKKKQLVMALRNLGLMHIVDVVQKGEESDRREKDKAAVQKVVGNLESYVDKKNPVSSISLSDSDILTTAYSLLSLMDEEQKNLESIRLLRSERDRISSWGDFDPNELKALEKEGIFLHFYSVGKKDIKALSLDENVRFIPVSVKGGQAICVSFLNSRFLKRDWEKWRLKSLFLKRDRRR